MIGIRVFGIGNVIRKRKEVSTLAMRTFMAMRPSARKIYGDVKKYMPVLTRNAQDAVVYDEDTGRMRITIRLPAYGAYGRTDYFPCWPNVHHSIAEHTRDEIAHAKARGAMQIQANPMAVPGGRAERDRDPFVRALSESGFTDIRVIESGPKGKQRTYDANPPQGWPFIRKG